MYEPAQRAMGPASGLKPAIESAQFDPECARCSRLVDHLAEVRKRFPEYHCRPVPAFGAANARLLIVGLAPGLHGANASGRPFTGDQAGDLLFRSLHRFGFSDRPESRAGDDGLRLRDCRITNAVKCLPPGNLPNGTELTACNGFLAGEIARLPTGGLLLALGGVAHRAVIKACGLVQSRYRFVHGGLHRLPNGLELLDSYHCSRYNLQTRRLTPDMFNTVLARARDLL